jgi:putative ABC transport system substrate-binding protein
VRGAGGGADRAVADEASAGFPNSAFAATIAGFIGRQGREFLFLVGSAAAAWPLVGRAQQRTAPRRVGVLAGLAPGPDSPGAHAFLTPFHDAMREAGWVEGDNVCIDTRYGGALADLARTRASAAELVALAPDIIYAQGLPATLALHAQTATTPIVFTQLIDPVGFGLAASLGHPGGNITGFVVWILKSPASGCSSCASCCRA